MSRKVGPTDDTQPMRPVVIPAVRLPSPPDKKSHSVRNLVIFFIAALAGIWLLISNPAVTQLMNKAFNASTATPVPVPSQSYFVNAIGLAKNEDAGSLVVQSILPCPTPTGAVTYPDIVQVWYVTYAAGNSIYGSVVVQSLSGFAVNDAWFEMYAISVGTFTNVQSCDFKAGAGHDNNGGFVKSL